MASVEEIHNMDQYQALLGQILESGTVKGDRTGTGTKSIFGHQMRFDLTKSFPLVTAKRIHFKSVVHELLWMLSGFTNVQPLQRAGVTIWDEWADENGDLGPVYGKQWRSWTTYKPCIGGGFHQDSIDQIGGVVAELKRNPDSRRLIVSAWNPADLDQMALAPCHCLFQFNTRPMTQDQRVAELIRRQNIGHKWNVASFKAQYPQSTEVVLDSYDVPSRYLDCQLYQRSADVFLGVPFNIASYALMTHMIAEVTGMVAGDFVWTGGDVHLYANHFEQARTLLEREPREPPQIRLTPGVKDLLGFRYEDIVLEKYDPHPAIAAPVAV